MIFSESILLQAAIEDWMRAIVPLVFIIFWVISQVFGNGEKKPQRPAQRRPNRPPPGDGGPVGEDRIRSELQEFLRDAAQRGKKPAQRPEQRAPLDEIVEAQVVEPDRPRVREAMLQVEGRKASRTAASDSYEGRSSHLGDEVAVADEKVEAHLHQVFDHDIGRIQDAPIKDRHQPDDGKSTQKIVVPRLAQEIRQMFREPKSVRNAIVMSEVLRRPDERW